jgi:hypothetical protein
MEILIEVKEDTTKKGYGIYLNGIRTKNLINLTLMSTVIIDGYVEQVREMNPDSDIIVKDY